MEKISKEKIKGMIDDIYRDLEAENPQETLVLKYAYALALKHFRDNIIKKII